MTELRRLLDDDCDELAQAMLRAATDEQPPQGSLTAVAAALGVAPALTGLSWLGAAGSSAAAAPAGTSGAAGAANAGASLTTVVGGGAGAVSAASSLSALVVAKYVAIGMVGGLVAMGGMTLAGSGSPKASAPSQVERSSAQTANVATNSPVAARAAAFGEPASEPASQAPVAAVVAGEAVSKLPARNTARARPSDEPATSVAATTPDSAATASAAAFADESPKPVERVEQNKGLTRELGLLDRARGALLAGNASEALGILDQYRKVRESMILDPEAEALRILALDRQGQHATASRLAREFIASHPASRQVDSLRALAGKN